MIWPEIVGGVNLSNRGLNAVTYVVTAATYTVNTA